MNYVFNNDRNPTDGFALPEDGTDLFANLDMMFVSFLHIPSGQA